MNMTMLRTLLFSLVLAAGIALPSHAADKAIGNYSYDGSGNVTSVGPASDGLSSYYYYDSAGRLIRFARKPNVSGEAVLEETYEYDGYGNLTKLTTNGVAEAVPVTASTNRLTTAAYDAAGNVTSHDGVTYQFDPVGTLTRKTGSWGSAFYIYTADGERLGIEGPDGTWRYMVRDLDAKVLREWSASTWNGNLTWVEDYIYRDGRLAAAMRPASQGGTRHFHLDHLGTPRLISGPDGREYASHDYYPFGREITDPTQEMTQHHFDTPEPMKFTGHERDFAGSFAAAPVDYMHARYYTPHWGRFLSIDPAQASAKPRLPQSWNRYAYALNNPVKFLDPDGKVTVGFTGFGNPPGSGIHKIVKDVDGARGLGRGQVFRHQDVDKAVKFVMAEHTANPGQAIVITGHSFGAESAIETAEKLGKAGVNVDLVLTIDPVFGDKTVSSNVETAHNFFQNQETLGGEVIQPSPGSNTTVQNTLVVDADHTSIDNDLADAGIPQQEIKNVGENQCTAGGGHCPP